MSQPAYFVSFAPATYPPVQLSAGANLSEHLTCNNSPVLFGCRTAICGTCLSEIITQENGTLPVPATDEKELLEIVAPDNPRARLACQIELCADLQLKYLGTYGQL